MAKTKTGNADESKKLTATKKAKAKASGSKAERWNARYEECKAFQAKKGHCKVPTRYEENKALGVWVQEQRRNFKLQMIGGKVRTEITQEQLEKLDAIGFHWGFTPDPMKCAETDASWQANFSKLQEYQETQGNFNVPMDGGEQQSRLAKWTRVQRHQYNLKATKRKSPITKERIQKLEEIGFDWDGPRKMDG